MRVGQFLRRRCTIRNQLHCGFILGNRIGVLFRRHGLITLGHKFIELLQELLHVFGQLLQSLQFFSDFLLHLTGVVVIKFNRIANRIKRCLTQRRFHDFHVKSFNHVEQGHIHVQLEATRHVFRWYALGVNLDFLVHHAIGTESKHVLVPQREVKPITAIGSSGKGVVLLPVLGDLDLNTFHVLSRGLVFHRAVNVKNAILRGEINAKKHHEHRKCG